MKRSLLLAVSAGVLCLLSACGGGSSPMKVLPLMITSAAPPGGTIQTTYDAAANGFSFTASGVCRRMPGAGRPPRVLLCLRA